MTTCQPRFFKHFVEGLGCEAVVLLIPHRLRPEQIPCHEPEILQWIVRLEVRLQGLEQRSHDIEGMDQHSRQKHVDMVPKAATVFVVAENEVKVLGLPSRPQDC